MVALAVAAVALAFIFLFGRPMASEARTTLPEAAAEAPPPARVAGVAPNVSDAALSGRPVHVGVFGDSFGDGIWWALDQQLRGEDDIALHRLARPSTGFTSYGHEWRQVIGARVDAVVALLRARGVQVYWVGLPRMRAPAYEEKARALSSFFAARMRALNVPFIDTVASTSDTQGRYVDRLPNPRTGQLMMARSGDGIHMTMKGYTILTQGLARHLRSAVASARAEAARINARQASARPRGAGANG
jgi:uncharacterized protein